MEEQHYHLVVLQHGNHGFAEDLARLERELHTFLRQYIPREDPNFFFLRPKSNEGNNTHDGILTLADRVAKELREYIAAAFPSQGTIYLTMVAHSLGGVICRALAKVLAEAKDSPEALVENGGRIVFNSYVSLNSPHVGSKRPSGLWGVLVNTVVNNTYGATGRELMLSDNAKMPLLLKMATEGHGYLEAMRKFKSRTLVAALEGDHAVPVGAASIRWSCRYARNLPELEFAPHWRIVGYDGFPAAYVGELFPKVAVHAEFLHGCAAPTPEQLRRLARSGHYIEDERGETLFHLEMLKGLQSLPWRRIEFHYDPGHPLWRLKVHDFSISKKQMHTELSAEATRLIAQLLALDCRAAGEPR